MAPRSRSRSAQAASSTAGPVGIADLPDDVLQRCLGFLDLRERLCSVALVSRRFAAAACSPGLLLEVDVGQLGSLRALYALMAWLRRHVRHIRQLVCTCLDSEDEDLGTALASCLAVAGGRGRLETLAVYGSIGSTDWLPAMRSLRHLKLRSPRMLEEEESDDEGELDEYPLFVSAGITMLTELASLDLEGQPVSFGGDSPLPPSITRLHLNDSCGSMPQQVADLPKLARLSLRFCGYSPHSMAQLSRLSGSLTRLDVHAGQLPGVLFALTQLQHLHVDCCSLGGDAGAPVDATLQHLTQLTCLVLRGQRLCLPSTLPCLSNLRHCYLARTDQLPAEFAAEVSSLPGGPWLHKLHYLGASLDTLVASTAQLSQAQPQLKCLEVTETQYQRPFDWSSPPAAAFMRWLAQHPAVARVSFEGMQGASAFDSREFAGRLAQLARGSPNLLVRCSGSAGDFNLSMLEVLSRR